MKRIVENSSLSDYFFAIKEVINEESTAIASYDEVLSMNNLPASIRPVIEEIRDDEKDHLVILTNLLQDLVEEELPDYGDEENSGMMEIEEE